MIDKSKIDASKHGLEFGPWTIAYHSGEQPHVTPGFTFTHPIQDAELRVYVYDTTIVFENFDAIGATEAAYSAAVALRNIGYMDGPDPKTVRRMKGHKNGPTRTTNA